MTEISTNLIDLLLFSDKRSFAQISRFIARPLYLTSDDVIVVSINSEFRKLYKMFDGSYACFLSDPTYDFRLCRMVRNSEIWGERIREISHIPKLLELVVPDLDCECDMTQNQFGTFLKFIGPESVFEALLVDIFNGGLPKVLSWEEIENKKNPSKNAIWRAKFSPLINIYSLAFQVSKLLKLLPAETGRCKKNKNEPEGNEPTSAEIQAEASNLEKIAAERVSGPEKLLRQTLYYSFENLALHPEINVLLKRKISSCGALITTLKKINAGAVGNFKNIAGAAGSKGWSEFAGHISDGRSKKIRIYSRKSQAPNCKFDIFVEYKRDKSSQDRTLKRLSKMKPFTTREVIFE